MSQSTVVSGEGGGSSCPPPHPVDKGGKPLMYLKGEQLANRYEPAPRGNPSNKLRLHDPTGPSNKLRQHDPTPGGASRCI